MKMKKPKCLVSWCIRPVTGIKPYCESHNEYIKRGFEVTELHKCINDTCYRTSLDGGLCPIHKGTRKEGTQCSTAVPEVELAPPPMRGWGYLTRRITSDVAKVGSVIDKKD